MKVTGAATPSDTTSWYREDGWLYRKKITIDNTNVDSDLTDFPLYVFIEGTGSGSSLASKIQDSGQDLRFTDSSGVRTLPHEIESYSEASGNVTAYVWVKVPTVNGSSDTNIYMYYGNSGASDGQDAANVWDSNYKGVWHSKDATTTTISDSTTNANTGTKLAVGEPVEATGKIGKAQDYDGTNDYVDAGSSATLDVPNITLSAWIKADSLVAWSRIIAMPSSFTYKYVLGLGSGNNFGGAALTNTYKAVSPINSLAIGAWYHLVLTCTSADLALYLNGQAQVESSVEDWLYAGTTVWFGRRQTPAYPFNGLLDEVRISNTDRSADWIKFEYNNVSQADNELTWGSEDTSSFTRTKGGIWVK